LVKISVIIPIYNSEKYIEKCINSIVNQTLKDIEIICVNDGSTDNTENILNDFAQKDSRIKILNQENQGQGAARNYGLSIATGEYVGYVDADDYIELNYFETLYNTAKKYNSEIAVASILKHKKFYDKYNVFYKNEKVASSIAEKIKLCGDVKKNFFYAWNKIYKRELLIKNEINFPQGQIYEDVMFAIKALYYSKSLVSSVGTKYHYVEHKTSTIKRKDSSGKKQQDLIKAYSQLQIFCKKLNISLPERLNYHTIFYRNPFVKTYKGEYKEKNVLLGLFVLNKKEKV
jgi:glycosyltransferase involved in cell wall biosynthesis